MTRHRPEVRGEQHDSGTRSRRGFLALGAGAALLAGGAVAAMSLTSETRGRGVGLVTVPPGTRVIEVNLTGGDLELIGIDGQPATGSWSGRVGEGEPGITTGEVDTTFSITAHPGVDLTLSVPADVELRVATTNGDVTGEELRTERITVQGSHGDVELEWEVAPVEVSVTTTSGDVSIELPEGSGPNGYAIEADTRNGDLDVMPSSGSRPIRVRTTNGDIEVSD
ncbi:DUF4097 family beta strand repeat-containing protein [Propionibacteriaceae bacterium Y2011]|uniref:DUF4097 family beta strand repeat-containing protein n=1 Tax=Microlunatus sp. Y2014 TaxID=3418488 RepID=UPI003B4DF1D2